MSADLEALEARISYTFRDRSLLVRSLTHKSWLFDIAGGKDATPAADNEQYEFLGDAILGFLASDLLVTLRPDLPEGQLSRLKAHMVSSTFLHEVARRLDLGRHLVLGRSEEMSGGRAKKALLANAVEAILAAMYLDGGMEPCRRFVVEEILGQANLNLQQQEPLGVDAKSALQELAQARKLPQPRYVTVQERGPEHAKMFVVEARVGKKFAAQAEGASKKAAAQVAAQRVLDRMKAMEEAGDVPGPEAA